MDFIKNLNGATDRIKEFALSMLTQIVGLSYYVDLEDDANTAYLEASFAVETPHDESPLMVTLKFSNVSGLKLDGVGQVIHLGGLSIDDMKNQGWELSQRFLVKDYEDAMFELKCASVEILGVKELYE